MFSIRSVNNYDELANSELNSFKSDMPSMTKQEFKDDADINVIMERFGVTGVLPPLPLQPSFGDFSDIGNYQDVQNKLLAAERSFMSLPSEVRDRFGQDPLAFSNFATDPQNVDQLRDWGLMSPAPAPVAPVMVQVVESPPSID
jgi:hypothetical protein